jgi:hypothetical protein
MLHPRAPRASNGRLGSNLVRYKASQLAVDPPAAQDRSWRVLPGTPSEDNAWWYVQKYRGESDPLRLRTAGQRADTTDLTFRAIAISSKSWKSHSYGVVAESPSR